MIFPSNQVRIVIATKPVDFRKGHDGLAALVKNELRKEPFTGTVFVFRAKRADRLKLLYWDGTGLVMAYKRLEETTFTWPAIRDGLMSLNHAQFEALFVGLDWRKVKALAARPPTAAEWFELAPVYEALLANLKSSSKLYMDETTAPVLDPGRRKTKTGYFWALARDDRPWGSDDPPGVAFTYAPGRSGQYADKILSDFSGVLQVDGYAGYNRLLKRPAQDVQLAYCWAHARRKLHEVSQTGTTPIADEGLKQIGKLYRIEKDIRGLSPDARRAARQERSKPIIEAFEVWLTANRARVSAKSPIGEALKYIAKYRDGLIRFLEDGRIEMDSNAVERTIRPIALNRKNALFAGHDAGAQNWAMIASLIETSKLNGVDPHAWLVATLSAIAQGHKQSDIDALLPWNYKGLTGGQGHEHHRVEDHA